MAWLAVATYRPLLWEQPSGTTRVVVETRGRGHVELLPFPPTPSGIQAPAHVWHTQTEIKIPATCSSHMANEAGMFRLAGHRPVYVQVCTRTHVPVCTPLWGFLWV